MLEVLYFSQKDVKARLLERALHPHPLLVVTAVRHGDHMRPVEEREPFRTLERRFGDVLHWVVVADDGKLEGMWRDPVGDLADRFFPEDSQAAFAAANGYLILAEAQVEAVVKKNADPAADVWFLQEALAAAHRGIPRPDRARRPGATPTGSRPVDGGNPDQDQARRPASGGTASGSRHADDGTRRQDQARRPGSGGAASGARHASGADDPDQEERTGPRVGAQRRARSRGVDPWDQPNPWTLLGLSEGATLAEGRKAFRALVAQYHPDKVQHLAPEFRELAERRTRQIIAAWESLEPELT